jgi:hypothetical protein
MTSRWCSITSTVLPRSTSRFNTSSSRHILEVQSGGRLVEDVERAAGLAPQFAGQFDALRLAAGERGGRLPEVQVAQPDIHQRLPAWPAIAGSSSSSGRASSTVVSSRSAIETPLNFTCSVSEL